MSEQNLFVRAVQTFVPEPCYTRIFTEFNLFNVECLKIVISKCLGYSIILGSVLVKLPQILKITKSQSGEGISILSVIFELLAISANAAYGFSKGFPFSSYGEGAFLAIQTSLVMFLVLFYAGNSFGSFAFLITYSGIMGYLLSPQAPVELIEAIQGINILIVIASKLIQVAANYKNSSTGQLSAITVGLIFLGSVARIFTSIQETGDQLIVITYIVSSLCNAMIVWQMIYYWGKKDKHE